MYRPNTLLVPALKRERDNLHLQHLGLPAYYVHGSADCLLEVVGIGYCCLCFVTKELRKSAYQLKLLLVQAKLQRAVQADWPVAP